MDLAQHDKRRYDEEMEIFRHPLLHHPMDITNNTLSSSITSKTKKRKDPNAPKGPRTGFHFFLTQKREEIERENPGKMNPLIVLDTIVALINFRHCIQRAIHGSR